MQPLLSASTTAPLRNRGFLKLLAFRVQVVLAYQIMMVVVGWHVYELTHDTLALGLVGLAEAIPYFCCALFAGYAVDHHSRRMFGVFASAVTAVNRRFPQRPAPDPCTPVRLQCRDNGMCRASA